MNLACGNVTESFGFRFVGSEGQMTVGLNGLTLSQGPSGDGTRLHHRYIPGEGTRGVPTEIPAAVSAAGRQRRLDPRAVRDEVQCSAEYSAHLEHHRNFYNAVRTRKPFFEDSVFGLRTAGPSLLTNTSLAEGRPASGTRRGWSKADTLLLRPFSRLPHQGAQRPPRYKRLRDQTAGAVACSWWISCRLHTRIGSRCCDATASAAALAPLIVVMQGTR